MQASCIKNCFPPNPRTKESYTSCFIRSRDNKWLGYCARKIIVLRNMEDVNESKVFDGHIKPPVALTFHPDGKMIASADESNTIIFWNLENLKIDFKMENAFSGKINGLEFIMEGNKLLVYGEGGKNKAKVIDWVNKKDYGEIEGCSYNVLCGCYSPKAPYGFFIGNEFGEVLYYEEDEGKFKLKSKNQAHLKGKFVSVALSSPDGMKFVTCSFDKKIITYDIGEGKIIDTIETNKIENGHQMAIVSAAFIDDERLITGSLDKTVKVWNLKEKKVIASLILKEGKLDAKYKLCGVETNGKNIFAVALNSIIYSWNIDNIKNNQLPDTKFIGHKGTINSIIYDKEGKCIITGDTEGLIILWPDQGKGTPISIESDQNYISFLAFSCDKSLFFSIDGRGLLIAYDKTSLTKKFEVKDLGGHFVGLCTSRKNSEDIFLLSSDTLTLLKNDKVVKKQKLSFKASALEVNEDLGEILVGDLKGKLHILDMELKEKETKDILYSEYSIMKFSECGKYIASGDNQRNVIVLDAATKEKLCTFSGHTAKIFSIDWTSDSKYLVSGSLDGNAIVCNRETGKKEKIYNRLDSQVSQVCFINDDKDFVAGGSSATIKIIGWN